MADRGWLVRRFPTSAARWVVGMGIGAIVLVVAVRASVQTYRIPSGGMAPTLLIGDHIVASSVAYGLRLPGVGSVATWGAPDRGDVLVFRYPRDPSLVYIQRVVAVAGDRVAVRDHRVILNGEEVPWAPAAELDIDSDRCEPEPNRVWTETLPTLAGAQRPHAVALTRGGPRGPLADADEIEVPTGHVLTLGDHRDASDDGRRWGVLPIENIVGRAEQRWFSWDECRGASREGRAGTWVQSGALP